MNILVYRIGGIGDMIIALPALWAIRQAFSDAKITYLTDLKGKTEKAVIDLLPKEVYDEVLFYKGALQLLKFLSRRFDSIFYLMNRNRDLLRIKRDKTFFRLIARRIYGISHLEKVRLDSKKSVSVGEVKSEYEYLLDCLYTEKSLQLPCRESLRPDLKLTEDERKKASEWISENTFGKMPIAIMASSAWGSKKWREDGFVEVILRLIEARDVFPLVFGGEKEKGLGERLINIWGRGKNLAGQMGLRMDAAILERCKLYLGNDTGTMHLAAAVGTRCVVTFSGVDYPGRWNPYGTGHRIIRKKVDCEICYQRKCPKETHECMEKISVDEVYKACLEVLDS